MKSKRRFVSFMLLLSLGWGASGCATYKVHPEFKERQKSLRTVAALPPDVGVYRLTFGGKKEPMYELYPQVSKGTIKALEGVFAEKGYQIRPLDLREAALEAEPELRTTLYTVHEVFKKTIGDIQKRRQKKFIYRMGAPGVNSLADRADADALLLIKWEAYKKSGGEIAKDIAKTVLIAAATLGSVIAIIPPSYATAHFALVDGNTGEILWYHNNLNNAAVNVEVHEQLTVAISRMLRPFPISEELKEKRKAKRKKRRPEANVSSEQPAAPVSVPVPAPAL